MKVIQQALGILLPGAAGYNNTTGIGNVALGYNVLSSNTTGDRNVGIGYYSLANNTGRANFAAGYEALYQNIQEATT